MARLRALVLFGGRSGEHEVSVVSARSVIDALDVLGHDVVAVGITREGRWTVCDPRSVERRVPASGASFSLAPDPTAARDVDVAIPVLHGPYGEDGCYPSLFERADIPYVGAGVEASAVGMNKVTQKRLFTEAGIPIVDYVAFTRSDWSRDADELLRAIAKLGFPSFAKPARLGSSVGISKVHDEPEVVHAVERAFHHDDLVLVEAAGGPRELEVGVLDAPPQVSVVGEVVPDGEFYDYRAKYAGEWTELRVPADVPAAVEDAIRDLALRAFHTSGCEGLARVDFFFDPATERLLVNELNTIPGLTPSSMFPRVWEASGIPFHGVVERLLTHALARHERKTALEAARAAHHDDEVG